MTDGDSADRRDQSDRDSRSSIPSKPIQAPPPAEHFDWRGWLLVGALAVCLLVIPGVILFLPAAEPFLESLGLSMRDAYLALPMVPAVILGALAVWSALASRREE